MTILEFGNLKQKQRWNIVDGEPVVSCPTCGWNDPVGQRGWFDDDGVRFMFKCKNPEPVKVKSWGSEDVMRPCNFSGFIHLLPKSKRKRPCPVTNAE